MTEEPTETLEESEELAEKRGLGLEGRGVREMAQGGWAGLEGHVARYGGEGSVR